MKNRKFMLLLTILLSIFMMCGKVNALKIHQEAVKVDDQYVVKVYNNTATGDTNKTGLSRDMKLTVTDDNGQNPIVVYCVDFGKYIGMSSSFAEHDMSEVRVTDLRAYLANRISDANVLNSLIERLNFIYYYGYSLTSGSTRNNIKYYLAAQAMVWQSLSDAGYYGGAVIEDFDDLYTAAELAELKAHQTKTIFQLSNIRFMKFNYNLYQPGNVSQSHPIPYVAADVVDLDDYNTAIETNITKYKTLPDFGVTELSLKPGETKVLTDSKGVFKHYDKVKCENATCTKNENKLTIVAGNTVGANINIEYQRSASVSGVESKVYQGRYTNDDGQQVYGQGVGAAGGSLPTKTIKLTGKIVPEPEACYFCTSGEKFRWGNFANEPGCSLLDNVTQENCKESSACYICTEGDKYRWGDYSSDTSCTLHEEIEANKCRPNPGCYVCDDEYVWSNDGEPQGEYANCELQDEIEEKANCKPTPEPKCYVCKNNSYKWSIDNPDPNNCVAHPEIHQANCVFTPQTSGLKIAYVSLICGIIVALGFVYFYSKKPENK